MAPLSGRSALVTGSTGGIGVAIAQRMAADGAFVIVTGRRAAPGEQVVAEIERRGGRAAFVAADLGSPSGPADLASRAIDLGGGRLDILVNNAAALVGARATVDTPIELIDTVLATNVRAPILLTAAVIPGMLAHGSGSIINVGSINGVTGMGGAALYGASKAALHSLTKSWVAEWGRAGIRVNTVAPGPTATEWNRSMAEHLTDLIEGVPSGRMSEADEVAAVVSFLASGDASHVHGATIAVDGGMAAASHRIAA